MGVLEEKEIKNCFLFQFFDAKTRLSREREIRERTKKQSYVREIRVARQEVINSLLHKVTEDLPLFSLFARKH